MRRTRQGELAALIAGLALLLPAIGPVMGKQVEITWAKRTDAHGSMEGGKGYVETVVQEFERLNPDIKVNFRPLAGDWTNKLTTEMIGGTAPDVFEMWGDFSVNWAENGMLLDLRPYVKRDFTAEYIKGFYPGQWDASVVVSGPRAGLRYGIPRYTNSIILFYNKDALDRAGVQDPHQMEQAKNWTWNTLVQTAKKAMQYQSDRVTRWGYQEYRWAQWVWSNGGKVFDFPQNPTRYMMDRPEAVAGLDFLRSLAYDHQVAAPDRWSVSFPAGQVAIATGWGSCCIRGWESEIKGQFKWNIAPIPVGPTGKRVSGVFLDMWGIYSQSKNPDAAWKFVKFLLSPYAMAVAARMFGEQPAHINGLRAYVEAFKDINARYAVESALTAEVWFDAVVPRSKEVTALVNQAVEDSAFTNKKPVEQAVAGIRPAIEALLQQK